MWALLSFFKLIIAHPQSSVIRCRLGSPRFIGSKLDDWLIRRELSESIGRPRRISFTQHSIQLPTSPAFTVNHPPLWKFDKILRSPICKIVNFDLSISQWHQAGLPICDGSVGIRMVPSFTLPTRLASMVGSISVQSQDIILSRPDKQTDLYSVLTTLGGSLSSQTLLGKLYFVNKPVFFRPSNSWIDMNTGKPNFLPRLSLTVKIGS